MGASPGPWRWSRNAAGKEFVGSHLQAANGSAVFEVDYGTPVEGDADRTLIRLAPDMASMLRELEWYGGSCPRCGVERFTGHAGEGMAEHLVPVEPPPHAPDCRLAALLAEIPK